MGEGTGKQGWMKQMRFEGPVADEYFQSLHQSVLLTRENGVCELPVHPTVC